MLYSRYLNSPIQRYFKHKRHNTSDLKLKEKNPTINIEKTKIAVKEISYLGFKIDDGEIKAYQL